MKPPPRLSFRLLHATSPYGGPVHGRFFSTVRALKKEVISEHSAGNVARQKAALENGHHSYRAPRSAIVLCHGLLGFDVMGPSFAQLHYWRGVKEALNAIGCEVIIARVPRAADVSVRAKVLKESLDAKIKDGKSVNLIAHSMGGLDSRYMISHLLDKPDERKFKINSLTTIATPHHGSSMASVPFISTAVERLISSLYRTTSIDVRAFTDLTPAYLRDVFNPSTPDDPSVAYFSYGADGTESVYSKPFIYPFRLTFEYLAALEGPNDGLVSVESAKWGQYIRTLKADHLDLINIYEAYKWEAVVKSMDKVERAEEALKQGKKVLDKSGITDPDPHLEGELRDAHRELKENVEAKKDDLVKQVEEKQFNAIELYLETATMLADKGF
ncbi:hypothetical protein HDU89_008015 [Geranomyces variabilis]|nr:hypothetical protein HDU89_008015 [Geranomyces variabilis]